MILISRTTAVSLLAAAGIALSGAALAADGASAQPNDAGGDTSSSQGRDCTQPDGNDLPDGSWKTWRTKGSRGSVTCTDGTLCTSSGTKQGNGSWVWHYECTESPGMAQPQSHPQHPSTHVRR